VTRPVPELAVGWTDGVMPKRYTTKRSAYYAIAKRLVIEKYPPMLLSEEPGYPLEWTPERADMRMDKASVLFLGEDGAFCTDRWRRFITRVARYLAFVDGIRGIEAKMEMRSLAEVQRSYERNERASTEFGARAIRDLEIIRVAEAKAGR
jgi:hypothetical protein